MFMGCSLTYVKKKIIIHIIYLDGKYYFSFGGSPFNNKSLILHESVSLDWQRDSAPARSASLPKGLSVSIRVINARDSRMEWIREAKLLTCS